MPKRLSGAKGTYLVTKRDLTISQKRLSASLPGRGETGGKGGGGVGQARGKEGAHLVEVLEAILAGDEPPLEALLQSQLLERFRVALFLGRDQQLPPPRRRPPARLLKVDVVRLSHSADIQQADGGVLEPEQALAAARRRQHTGVSGRHARAGVPGPLLYPEASRVA